MRIALFGGSFNPPHVGHQLAALYVLETADVDELWFIPSFKHPFQKALEPFEDRFHMCELAAAALGARARVSDVERELGEESRTLRTLRALEARHPEHRFALVVGADLVAEIGDWYGADELRRAAPFIVVGRAGAASEEAAGAGAGAAAGAGGAARAAVEMPAVSSTAIRRALADGKSVSGLVSRAVLDYIYGRGLFQAREPA
jgi:nicotinate-nucleotide adenylyltransferase